MKPVLLGMNNPNSEYPEFALYPDPPRCAGWNLWQLTGLTKEGYLDSFERMNLMSGRIWSPEDARKGADVLREQLAGRTVVMLGEDVARLMWLGIRDPSYTWRSKPEGGWWAKIPHPSGRCRHWNDPLEREMARIFFRELMGPLPDDEKAPAVEPGPVAGDWAQLSLL